MNTKICNKCGIEKDLEEFPIEKGKYRSCCKECRNKYLKEYHLRNKEKANKASREYYKKHKEKMNEQSREYQKNNKEKLKLKRKLYNEANIDYFVNYLLQTYKNNYGIEWDKKEKVHIDHIIPLKNANTEEDVIRLCHYTNLQLLKAKDNLKKGSKKEWELKQ